MLSGTYLVLVLLAGPVAASASTAEASCSLSAHTTSPGDVITARVEHVARGTQVTLTFDGASVGDAVTDATGVAAVNWTVPNDASAGDPSVVLVGQSVYCNASANGFRVVAGASGGPAAPDGSGTGVLAEGTVGAAAGRVPRETGAKPSGSGAGGASPLVVAVAAIAGVAAIGGGAQAVRVVLRRRIGV